MGLLTNTNTTLLWREVIKEAEGCCDVELQNELESYLISLLVKFTDKPEIVKQILAMAFMDAQHMREKARQTSLQNVGDQCLILAGLFPRAAERRLVTIRYFVDLGQSSYIAISRKTDDLFDNLAVQFVVLMDVLQSIRPSPDLLPLEAYEQWNEVGSKHALKILKSYTAATPFKLPKKY